MSKDNPKTEHEKELYKNTTEKGPLKKEHYNQFGKQDDGRKVRRADTDEDKEDKEDK